MINVKARASSHGRMAGNTSESGKTESSMAVAHISQKKVDSGTESGKTAKRSDGSIELSLITV
jgi:hypothetical protein